MPKYRFRVLRGSHRVGAKRDSHNHVIEPGKTYRVGDIIETSVDLAAKFPSVPPKFQRIDVVEEQEHDLASYLKAMTKAELVAKAEAEEIDITGLSTKEAIVEAFLTQLA